MDVGKIGSRLICCSGANIGHTAGGGELTCIRREREGGRVGALIDKMSGGWPRQLRLSRRRSESREVAVVLSGDCLLARCKVSRGKSGMEGSERGDFGL